MGRSTQRVFNSGNSHTSSSLTAAPLSHRTLQLPSPIHYHSVSQWLKMPLLRRLQDTIGFSLLSRQSHGSLPRVSLPGCSPARTSARSPSPRTACTGSILCSSLLDRRSPPLVHQAPWDLLLQTQASYCAQWTGVFPFSYVSINLSPRCVFPFCSVF